MKKTLIALFALAGAAVADSVPYTVQLDNMLESQTGWTTVNGSANWGTSGQVKVNGWNSGVFQKTFEQGYTLHQGDSIEFSYELTIKHNAALTLTLISDDKALVTGWGGYDTNHQVAMGITSTTTPSLYQFKDPSSGITVKVDVDAVVETPSASRDYTGTVTGVIEWSDTEDAFVCTLSTNETNAQTITLSQSPSYTLNSVVVCANGNAGSNPVSNMSNLSMTLNLPEPATATLSLLALAALAARRKRH